MFRFWSRYTAPLIELVSPRRIVEIGAEFGWNTQFLLAYCRRTGAHLDIVEPMPCDALREQLGPYGPEHYTLHTRKSVDAIPILESPDLIMLDGDHNWRTVFTELSMLRANAHGCGRPMPVVLAHDCAWPYARRDMYYDPAAFNESERKPFAYKGMLPGVSELVENGMNGHFANAAMEGGPENGVLTAIEDFVAANEDIRLWTLPFFNGFGIIVPEARLTPAILEMIDSFYQGESLMETCKELETDGMRVRADLCVARLRLEQRTDALQRARELLAGRAERIAELEARLQDRSKRWFRFFSRSDASTNSPGR